MFQHNVVKQQMKIGDKVYTVYEGRVLTLYFYAAEDYSSHYGYFEDLETNELLREKFEKIYFTKEEASSRLEEMLSRRKELLGR